MLDITCDECGKKYRVDETKMKGSRAKVKCKACSKVMAPGRASRCAENLFLPARQKAENRCGRQTARRR